MTSKRLLWLVVLCCLFICSGVKLWFEYLVEREQRQFRHGSVIQIKYSMRDVLGQGLLLASLGGFRGIAANFTWFNVTEAWSERQWTRVKKNVEIAVLLQPREDFFWDQGAWHMAWNASMNVLEGRNHREKKLFRSEKESRQWIDHGLKLLERGITINPESSQLHERLADLYYRRLMDYDNAAKYYEKASQLPGAKEYLLRLPGYMYEKAGNEHAEYEYWKQIWMKISEKQRQSIQWERPRKRILALRKKLD